MNKGKNKENTQIVQNYTTIVFVRSTTFYIKSLSNKTYHELSTLLQASKLNHFMAGC